MGKCDGYCRSENLKEQHDEAVAQAVSLLEGRFKEVKADLTAEMETAAEELRFEKAAEIRDRLRAIELLGARQKVVAGSLADTDVTGFFRGTAKSCFVVLHYVDGDLAAKDMELLETPMEEDEEEVLSLPHPGVLRGAHPPAQADSAALRVVRPGTPYPDALRAGGVPGGAGHPPSGGPRWI